MYYPGVSASRRPIARYGIASLGPRSAENEMYVGSRCEKIFGSLIRARKAEHLMTSIDEFADNSRTEKTCSSSDKNTHIFSFLSNL